MFHFAKLVLTVRAPLVSRVLLAPTIPLLAARPFRLALRVLLAATRAQAVLPLCVLLELVRPLA